MDTACPVCPEEAAERNHAGGMPGRPLWTQPARYARRRQRSVTTQGMPGRPLWIQPARYAGTGRYEWEMTA
jgi:hypothetical protein